jgi:predicted transcriptional regulator
MIGRTLTGFIRLRIWIKKDGDNVGLLAIFTEGRELIDRVKTIWL